MLRVLTPGPSRLPLARSPQITRQSSPAIGRGQKMRARRHRQNIRRDPGQTTPGELSSAIAPFARPPALTPFDIPTTFIVREEIVGSLRSHRMTFTPAAQATLSKLLDLGEVQAEDALEWLADELRWVFLELHGHARGYTQRELTTLLRAFARLHPDDALPDRPANLLQAIGSSERHRERGNLLPPGIAQRPEDIAHDAEFACESWSCPAETAELAHLADGLLRAVRRRRPGNWEQLARRRQWDPLTQGTIELSARMWAEALKRPPRTTKGLLAFTIQLLTLVDPSFPRSPDSGLVESIRARLTRAIAKFRTRPGSRRAAILPVFDFRRTR